MTTSETSRPARFPWALTIVSGPALALLIGLGVWQVQRLQWKEGLMDRADTAASMAPVPIADLPSGPDREFRQVIIDCPGLATSPYVELQSILDGEAGVRLISACPEPAAPGRPEVGVLLVDRGFVAGTVTARPPVTRDGTVVRLVAVVRTASTPGLMALPPEGSHFYARDNAAMARALGVTSLVGSETLYAATSTNPDWPALRPSVPPVAFANNHLGYALTWFGLALALIGFYIALVRRKLKS
jgi:surfeit locus 1 family protein